MTKTKNYKKTLIACYLGFITQAITSNFAPLLFLTFKSSYQISLEMIALIPLVFYMTQLLVDLVAVKFADKVGYRPCVVVSQLVSAAGLILMAFLPELLPNAFVGIIISVVLYAIGSGLVEVLLSPIVEACPFENKAGVMSLLHSFFCWGSVGVILGSTVFFAIFGIENWKFLAMIWALVPLLNTINFISCPIERLVEDGEGMRTSQLLRTPLFLLMILLMICAGASEATMTQWASAFTESALGISKTVGDLAGPCLFAIFMGIARVFYGKFSEKLNLTKVMLYCGSLCVVCYLTAALSPIPIIGLIGCALCACGWHYVAGNALHFLAKMPHGRHGNVCLFGVGRRPWCSSRSLDGWQNCGCRWRQPQNRFAFCNLVPCCYDRWIDFAFEEIWETETFINYSNSYRIKILATQFAQNKSHT